MFFPQYLITISVVLVSDTGLKLDDPNLNLQSSQLDLILENYLTLKSVGSVRMVFGQLCIQERG
jgi:hypothetical protein